MSDIHHLLAMHPHLTRATDLAATTGIPTGLLPLDHALGGGVPRGRLTEVHGTMTGGKLTVARALLETTLLHEARVAWIDLPGMFLPPESLPEALLQHLLVLRPRDPQQARNATGILARSGVWDLLIADFTGHRAQVPLAWLKQVTRVLRGHATACVLLHDGDHHPLGDTISLRLQVRRTRTPEGRALVATIAKNKLGHASPAIHIPLGDKGEAP